MQTVGDILSGVPVCLQSQQRVETAITHLRNPRMAALPVLEEGRVVGIVRASDLLGVSPDTRIDEVMERNVRAIPAALSLRQATGILVKEKCGLLIVLDTDERLLGVVTADDLLPVLRHSTDPLTDLPWSDTLREWAIEALQQGKEITILFVDVNDFGLFNKRYGHVVGDSVLRIVADTIRALTDPAADLLCRYGGDEFCLATLRSAADAERLAFEIEKAVGELRLSEDTAQSIAVVVGQRGGRRTREREHIHYAATLNSLINLASKACILRKEFVTARANQSVETC